MGSTGAEQLRPAVGHTGGRLCRDDGASGWLSSNGSEKKGSLSGPASLLEV